MLQDRPLYEEMVRTGSRGLWAWRAGNWLVRTGVIGIVLLLMAALSTLGSFLKRLSYRIALGEGIDVASFLAGQDEPKPPRP